MTDWEIREAIQPIRIRSEAEVKKAAIDRRSEIVDVAVAVIAAVGLLLIACSAGGGL